MKKSFTLFLVLLVSSLIAFTGCDDAKDALSDAIGDTTGGVKGKVTDMNGDGVGDADVYVIGAVNAIVEKATALPDAKDGDKIDVDKLIEILDGTKGLKKTTTESDGSYSVDYVDAAYIVVVKKDTYGMGLAGIHVSKKITDTIDDMKKADYELPATLNTDDCEFVMIAKSLTKKLERDFTLPGGPAPVEQSDSELAEQETPAPTVSGSAAASTEWSSAPDTKVTPSGDSTDNKDYYPFSFAFISGSEGSASGEFSVSEGQPIPIASDNQTYTYDQSSGWGGADTGTFDADAVKSHMITLTGCIPEYKNSTKILVFDVEVNGSWVTSKHYIGFNESGIYETRTIYLPKGFKTRLSMAEDDGDGIKNQSYKVIFDATSYSEPNSYIAIMTYDKGFAVEASKSVTSYNATCDMDFAVTNIKTGTTTAWYNSNNDDAFLTYDTWFGFGPEIIVGKVGSDISDGVSVYAEAYSIGSDYSDGLNMHITIITASQNAKFTKTYSHDFSATGDSWNVGTFDVNGNASSRR